MTSIENSLIILGYSGLALLVYIIIAFIVGIVKKNNGLIDIFYGPAYFVVSFTSFLLNYVLNGTFYLRQLISTLLVFVWAVRIATYIYIRNHGKPEDYRYAAMREKWKSNFVLKSLFKIYLFQGMIVFLVDIPVWFVNISTNAPITTLLDFFGITLWLGALVWFIGFIFETVGDWTLYKFLHKPENKGKVMDKSVWKYTQHPNYFGEVTQWWGLFIIALAVPFGFLTFVGPAYITFQIIKVSGVKLLDKRFEGDDEYSRYKKRTSSFFPWFPKKEKK